MNSLEPSQLLPFKAAKTEGPYADKSIAELQMIKTDATKWKDTTTLAAIQAELDARNGVKKKETAKAVKTLEQAVTPKKRAIKVTKTVKAKLP